MAGYDACLLMNMAFSDQIMKLLPPGPPNPLTWSHQGDMRTRSGDEKGVTPFPDNCFSSQRSEMTVRSEQLYLKSWLVHTVLQSEAFKGNHPIPIWLSALTYADPSSYTAAIFVRVPGVQTFDFIWCTKFCLYYLNWSLSLEAAWVLFCTQHFFLPFFSPSVSRRTCSLEQMNHVLRKWTGQIV